MDEKVKYVPIIKWVGGKRQLLGEIKARMPNDFNTYYEPFFGGGATFFELQPEKAVINDMNKELINMYRQVKTNSESVVNFLTNYENVYNEFKTIAEKSEYYYNSRTHYNNLIKNSILTSETAALFIFLNKTGFNGLHRVNKKGEFNVPFGKRDKINLYTKENLEKVSKILQGTTILCGDFEEACKEAKEGDFVYFDPPYYDTFVSYQAGGFGENDQKRVAELYKRLSDEGVKCMLMNTDCEFIRELFKDYKIEIVGMRNAVNRNGNNRGGSCLVVTNY